MLVEGDGHVVCVEDVHGGSVFDAFGRITARDSVKMSRGISFTSMFVTNHRGFIGAVFCMELD